MLVRACCPRNHIYTKVICHFYEAPEAALSLLVGQAVADIMAHPLGSDSLTSFFKANPEKIAAAVATIITFQVCVMPSVCLGDSAQ